MGSVQSEMPVSMTTKARTVKDLVNVAGSKRFPHIVNELCQDIDEYLFGIVPITRDTVRSLAYEAELILEVIDQVRFAEAHYFLEYLDRALHNWADDIEATNKLLGIPPEM
jgi:hypothetical protein